MPGRHNRGANYRDHHHILHHRAQWEAMPSTSALREMPGLLVDGPRELHERIHNEVNVVPPLSCHLGLHALMKYTDYPQDNLRSIDSLLVAIESALKHPKASDLERSLGQLTMQAIELQRPTIREMIGSYPQARRLTIVR